MPVKFTLDREHIIGHREAPGVSNGTSCPGILDIDRIVARALELAAPPDPEPEPEPDTVSVPKSLIDRLRAIVDELHGVSGA